MACAGDVPTLETLAAVQLLHEHTAFKIRVVNVVDLMRLQPERASAWIERPRLRHPVHEGQTRSFRLPWLSLADPSTHLPTDQSSQYHVRGYKEEGTISTPFDMAVMNDLDRFHLVSDVADRVPEISSWPPM